MVAELPNDLPDKDALELLLTCAFDLLAQTEAQQRVLHRAHADLLNYHAETTAASPTAARRKERLGAISRVVGELLSAVRSQRTVAVHMQETVSALQSKRRA